MKILIVILFSQIISSCLVNSHTQLYLPEVDEEDIQLFYLNQPKCEYQKVGLIEVDGGYHNKQELFNELINLAAEMGADGVVVDHLQRLDIKEYVALAYAIRCF